MLASSWDFDKAQRRLSLNRCDAIRFCSFLRFLPAGPFGQVAPSEGQLYCLERPLPRPAVTLPVMTNNKLPNAQMYAKVSTLVKSY